jgi:ferredoxin, 2Fe-2S
VPKVVYFSPAGERYVVDAASGDTLMATAVRHGVPGILAECGGNASCATCHVYIRDDVPAPLGEPGDMEEDLLDLAVTERRAGSRLACQIELTDALDGLTVDIPPVQP